MKEDLCELCYRMLYGCDLIYARIPRPRDDLLKAAELFAGDIADMARGMTSREVEEAFREHRKTSPYYPRPADINRALVYIRARYFAPPPSPATPSEGSVTPGIPEACARALKGDESAREYIDRIIRELSKKKE